MNKLLFGVFLAVNLFTLLSCSKDKETLNANGYWFGMSGTGVLNPNSPIGVLFRDNGTMRVYTNFADTTTAEKAEGTYTVSGMTVTLSYTYYTGTTGAFSAKATADPDDDETLNGTYGIGSSQTDRGTFYLYKQ